MIAISIITPTHKIIEASDLGAVRAALTVTKLWNHNDLTYSIADQPNRFARVVKWRRFAGKIITIKKPLAATNGYN